MLGSIKQNRLPVPLLATLLAGCSPDPIPPPAPKMVDVCQAIDKGRNLLGSRITIVGWLDISRHESRLGDRNCPSERRFTYLGAAFKTPVVVNVADPKDQQSNQVASDLRKFPVGVEWGMRGRFIGRLVARPSPDVESAFDPSVEVVPFTFVIEEIQDLKVERPPYLPPPQEPNK